MKRDVLKSVLFCTAGALVAVSLLVATSLVVRTAAGEEIPTAHTNQDGPLQTGLWIDRQVELVYPGLLDALDFSFALAFADLGTDCVKLSNESCGKGNVCWVCVCEDGNGEKECSWGCRAADGSCGNTPVCGCGDSSLFSG